jgi:hypothetical protein
MNHRLEKYYDDHLYAHDGFGNYSVGKERLADFQKGILSVFHNSDVVTIIKPRQMGYTTLLAMFISYQMYSFNITGRDGLYGKKILFITPNHKEFVSKVYQIISRSKYFNNNLIRRDRTNRLIYGGVELISNSGSIDAGKGDSIDLLVVDEAFAIRNFKDIWMAQAMAVSATNGKIILSSSSSETKSFDWFMEIHKANLKLHSIYIRTLLLETIQKNNFKDFKPFGMDLRCGSKKALQGL